MNFIIKVKHITKKINYVLTLYIIKSTQHALKGENFVTILLTFYATLTLTLFVANLQPYKLK